MSLQSEISACRICADRFAATKTRHSPRPVAWFDKDAPILIAGQAPGARVHESGIPFDDRSGDRLRDWLGVTPEAFYDRGKFAILPMAFCFPGYDKSGSDLPPPTICAQTWRDMAMDQIGTPHLTLLIGAYAQQWHLGGRVPVTSRVADWRATAPAVFSLPHPSWRNTGWLKRNPWFENDLLPALRAQVQKALS